MTASLVAHKITNVIFGCEGLSLSDAECDFFKDIKPAGFIFFKRNVANPSQFSALVAQCKAIVGERPALFLIDQEGGRVQRLQSPHWRHYPPIGSFGELYEALPNERSKILRALELNTRLLAVDLRLLGLNVNCLPLLDVPTSDGDNIIGDRAFSSNVDTITMLGKIVTAGLQAEGVLPVIKHIPGHGRATVDSHKSLPVVNTSLDDLTDSDFKAFTPFAQEALAMTAHVTYAAIDASEPATFSKTIIENIIREQIGFSGLLMSDDLSMNALKGGFSERARKTNAAGVDLLLHCNGNMAEMQAIAAEALGLTKTQCSKLNNAINALPHEHSSRQDLEDEYDALTARLAVMLKENNKGLGQ